MSSTKTSPQLTDEIWNVMHIQGYLVEYFIARGETIEKAQDFAQEAVHKFLTSDVVKPEYSEQYAALVDVAS